MTSSPELQAAATTALAVLREADPIAYHRLITNSAGTLSTVAYPHMEVVPVSNVDEYGDAREELQCPHCNTTSGVTVVDISQRWTEVPEEKIDWEAKMLHPDYDNITHYDLGWYKCTACSKPVSLPDGWTCN